jgi:hypothetical protein
MDAVLTAFGALPFTEQKRILTPGHLVKYLLASGLLGRPKREVGTGKTRDDAWAIEETFSCRPVKQPVLRERVLTPAVSLRADLRSLSREQRRVLERYAPRLPWNWQEESDTESEESSEEEMQWPFPSKRQRYCAPEPSAAQEMEWRCWDDFPSKRQGYCAYLLRKAERKATRIRIANRRAKKESWTRGGSAPWKRWLLQEQGSSRVPLPPRHSSRPRPQPRRLVSKAPSAQSRDVPGAAALGKVQGNLADLSFEDPTLDYSLAFMAQTQHNAAFRDLLWASGAAFPPCDTWLYSKMRKEWSVGAERVEHWAYVHQKVPAGAQPRGRDEGHQGLDLKDFVHHRMAKQAGLTLAEVAALRLYTGPAYVMINGSHRKGLPDVFPVTSYCLEAAIIKLALIAPKRDTLRGMSGRMPSTFVEAYEGGQSIRHGDAICDSAFMSTSKAINVAMTGNYGGQTLCVIRGRKNRDGFLRSGADVSWVSQYPHEEEVLFPCFTELWYVKKDKRDYKQKWYSDRNCKEVYEFTVRCYYNTKRKCPFVAGME